MFANVMMSAQADQACGAGYGKRGAERVNRRDGYRPREWDTRVGLWSWAIPHEPSQDRLTWRDWTRSSWSVRVQPVADRGGYLGLGVLTLRVDGCSG